MHKRHIILVVTRENMFIYITNIRHNVFTPWCKYINALTGTSEGIKARLRNMTFAKNEVCIWFTLAAAWALDQCPGRSPPPLLISMWGPPTFWHHYRSSNGHLSVSPTSSIGEAAATTAPRPGSRGNGVSRPAASVTESRSRQRQ